MPHSIASSSSNKSYIAPIDDESLAATPSAAHLLAPPAAAHAAKLPLEVYLQHYKHSKSLLLDTPINLCLYRSTSTEPYPVRLGRLLHNLHVQIIANLNQYCEAQNLPGLDGAHIAIEGYGSCWRKVISGQEVTTWQDIRDIDCRVDLRAIFGLLEDHLEALLHLLRKSLIEALRTSCENPAMLAETPEIFQSCVRRDPGQAYEAGSAYALYRLRGIPRDSTVALDVEFWCYFGEQRTYTGSHEDLFLRLERVAEDDSYPSIGSHDTDPSEAIRFGIDRVLRVPRAAELDRLGALRVVRAAAQGFEWLEDSLWQRFQILSLIEKRPKSETLPGIAKMVSNMQSHAEILRFLGYMASLEASFFKNRAAELAQQLGAAASPLLQPLLNWLLAEDVNVVQARLCWINPFLEAIALELEPGNGAWQAWCMLTENTANLFSTSKLGSDPPEELLALLAAQPICKSTTTAVYYIRRRLRHLRSWLAQNAAAPILQHFTARFSIFEEEETSTVSPAQAIHDLENISLDQALKIFERTQAHDYTAINLIQREAAALEERLITGSAGDPAALGWLLLSVGDEQACLHGLYVVVRSWMGLNSDDQALHRSVDLLINSRLLRRHLRLSPGLASLSVAQIMDGIRVALRDRLWPEAPPLDHLLPPRQLLLHYAQHERQLRSIAVLIDLALRVQQNGHAVSRYMVMLRPLFWIASQLNAPQAMTLHGVGYFGPEPDKRAWANALRLCKMWPAETFTDWLDTVLDNLDVSIEGIAQIQQARWELMATAYQPDTANATSMRAGILELLLNTSLQGTDGYVPDTPLLRAWAFLILAPADVYQEHKQPVATVLCQRCLTQDGLIQKIFERLHALSQDYQDIFTVFWRELDRLGSWPKYAERYAQHRTRWICADPLLTGTTEQPLYRRLQQLTTLPRTLDESLVVLAGANSEELMLPQALEILNNLTVDSFLLHTYSLYILKHWPEHHWKFHETQFLELVQRVLEQRVLDQQHIAEAVQIFHYLFCEDKSLAWSTHTTQVAANLIIEAQKFAYQKAPVLEAIAQHLIAAMRTCLECRVTALMAYQQRRQICLEMLSYPDICLTYVAMLVSNESMGILTAVEILGAQRQLVPSVFEAMLKLEALLRVGSEDAEAPRPYLAAFADRWIFDLTSCDRCNIDKLLEQVQAVALLSDNLPQDTPVTAIRRALACVSRMLSACNGDHKPLNDHLERIRSALIDRITRTDGSSKYAHARHIPPEILQTIQAKPDITKLIRELILQLGALQFELTPHWCCGLKLEIKEHRPSPDSPTLADNICNITAQLPVQDLLFQSHDYQKAAEITLCLADSMLELANGRLDQRCFFLQLLTQRAQQGDDLRHLFQLLHPNNAVKLSSTCSEDPEDFQDYVETLQTTLVYAQSTPCIYLVGIAFNNMLELLYQQSAGSRSILPLVMQLLERIDIFTELSPEVILCITQCCLWHAQHDPHEGDNCKYIIEHAFRCIIKAAQRRSPSLYQRLEQIHPITGGLHKQHRLTLLAIAANALSPSNNLSCSELCGLLQWSIESAYELYRTSGMHSSQVTCPKSLLTAVLENSMPDHDDFDAQIMRSGLLSVGRVLAAKISLEGAAAFKTWNRAERHIVGVVVAEVFSSQPLELCNWRSLALVTQHSEPQAGMDGRQLLMRAHDALLLQHPNYLLHKHMQQLELAERLRIAVSFTPIVQAQGLYYELVHLLQRLLDVSVDAFAETWQKGYYALQYGEKQSVISLITAAKDYVCHMWATEPHTTKSVYSFCFGASCCLLLRHIDALDNGLETWLSLLQAARLLNPVEVGNESESFIHATHATAYLLINAKIAHKPKKIFQTFLKAFDALEKDFDATEDIYPWIQLSYIAASGILLEHVQEAHYYIDYPELFEHFLRLSIVGLISLYATDDDSASRAHTNSVNFLEQLQQLINILPKRHQLPDKYQACLQRIQLTLQLRHTNGLPYYQRRSLLGLMSPAIDSQKCAQYLITLMELCWDSGKDLKLGTSRRKLAAAFLGELQPSLQEYSQELLLNLLELEAPLAGCTALHLMLTGTIRCAISDQRLVQLYHKVLDEIQAAEEHHNTVLFLRCLPLLVLRKQNSHLIMLTKAWAGTALKPQILNHYGSIRFYEKYAQQDLQAWQHRHALLMLALDTRAPDEYTQWLRASMQALQHNDHAREFLQIFEQPAGT